MFPFMNYHYFVEYYLMNYSQGNRLDYLARVSTLNVATPEEQKEWFNLMRPKVLKCWEEDLKFLRDQVLKSIDELRKSAIKCRNSSYTANLYWSHRYELEADYLEQRLNSGNITERAPYYKGYLNDDF